MRSHGEVPFPDGWTYECETFESPFFLPTVRGNAFVLKDGLRNTFMGTLHYNDDVERVHVPLGPWVVGLVVAILLHGCWISIFAYLSCSFRRTKLGVKMN